jgi:4-amino-4-deoxychorismate lyase
MALYCSIDGNTLNAGSSFDDLADDRGLAYGHGLFETILYKDGKTSLSNKHLERICRDAPKIGISVDSKHVQHCLEQFLQSLLDNAIYNGVVKIILTAGAGGRGYAAPAELKPSVICTFSDLPSDLQQQGQGIAVRCCSYRLPINPPLAGIKHLNRLDQIIARSEWNTPDYSEGLVFDTENVLVEAVSANVFVRQAKGDWLTPNIKRAGVNGVMRSLLLDELFSECGITVKVADINLEQLNLSQEIFICNSIRGIVPVTSIYSNDDRLQNTMPIGKDTKMLQTSLKTIYPQYL